MLLIKTLTMIGLCCCIQGRLGEIPAQCSSDVVEFWCTNTDGFTIWDFHPRTGSPRSMTLIKIDGVGHSDTLTINSSIIVGRITYINGTFINTTVTIMNPANINRSTIECNNRDQLTLNVPTRSINALPDVLNISVRLNNNTRSIYWTDKFGYCIQYSSYPTDNGQWYQYDLSPIPLKNSTYILISLRHELNLTSFIIGSCIFNDQSSHERTYLLYQNETWTIFQMCSKSMLSFNTTCDNGSWTVDKTCPVQAENTSTGFYSTTYKPTLEIISSKEPKEDIFQNNLTDLIASLIGVVVIFIIVGVTAILIFLYITWKKRVKKSNPEYLPPLQLFDMGTYESLSNKHPRVELDNSSGRQLPAVRTSQEEYAPLHRNKPALSVGEEYSTIPNIHRLEMDKRDLPQYGLLDIKSKTSAPNKNNGVVYPTSHTSHAQGMKYADVMPDLISYAGDNVIHMNVDYSDINLPVRPEDKMLNLDSLLIQLNSMSKEFRLFGSAAGISPDLLDKITNTCAAPYDGLVEVCDAWLTKCRQEGTPPTWSAVAEILSLIGRDKLSQDINQVYTTGKLPTEVDMTSLVIQREVNPLSPPPLPPPCREEDTVELMTVSSAMTSKQLSDRDVDESPPPLPIRPHDLLPDRNDEESYQKRPQLPPKRRKPIPAKRKQGPEYAHTPSLPPRPPKNEV